MAEEYSLRCSMCGTTQKIDENSSEQLSTAKHGGAVHFCDVCKAKVQYESDQKFK